MPRRGLSASLEQANCHILGVDIHLYITIGKWTLGYSTENRKEEVLATTWEGVVVGESAKVSNRTEMTQQGGSYPKNTEPFTRNSLLPRTPLVQHLLLYNMRITIFQLPRFKHYQSQVSPPTVPSYPLSICQILQQDLKHSCLRHHSTLCDEGQPIPINSSITMSIRICLFPFANLPILLGFHLDAVICGLTRFLEIAPVTTHFFPCKILHF